MATEVAGITQTMAGSLSDIDALAPSWRLSLEAENKSPATITSYGHATTQFGLFEANEAFGTGGRVPIDRIRELFPSFLLLDRS